MPNIQKSDLQSVFLVKAKKSNKRIIAQQGAFLVFGLESEMTEIQNFGFHLKRFTIPKSNKKKLLKELDRININESTMFPDIETSAKYLIGKLADVEAASVDAAGL